MVEQLSYNRKFIGLNLCLAGTSRRNRGKVKSSGISTVVEYLPNNHKFEGLNPAFAETGGRGKEKIKITFKTSAGSTVVE